MKQQKDKDPAIYAPCGCRWKKCGCRMLSCTHINHTKSCEYGDVIAARQIASEANARLIAAAPELLAACKAVLGMRIVCPEDAADEFELCRNAIATATGGKHD